MEQGQGSNSNTLSKAFDKNKVMTVRPLRCLVPIFSSPPGVSSSLSPQTAPFVCAPPNGPLPPGFNSFYPFQFSPDPQKTIENSQNPLNNSFSTPPAGPTNKRSNLDQNGSIKTQKNKNSQFLKEKGRYRKTPRPPALVADVDEVANSFLSLFDLTALDLGQNPDGDREIVRYVMMIMNSLRRRITQIAASREATQRPDLRAGAILMNKGVRTNTYKRVGPVPGVEIGDIFYFRMELCLVGMHKPSMGGIDYMTIKFGETEEPIALSIVSSGGYEDNNNDTDVIIYSGQGMSVNKKNKKVELSDQKLEKGNLALEKSLFHGNEVRVIRGLEDAMVKRGKIYIYDGLYKIQESWIEKGISGFNIFKYKLFRIPGQPQGFAIWKNIQQWKSGVSSRPGVILPDISSSREILPVSLVNEVDDEAGPANFTYFAELKYPKPINLPRPSSCSCQSMCQMNDPNCPCVQSNRGSLPYNILGVLTTFKSIIHECGSSCSCSSSCRNRVTQTGLKLRLEVFKTRDKGWGLRSLDPIRSGGYICEYAGEVIDKSTVEQLGRNNDDNFIFDATRRYEPHEIMIDGSDLTSKLGFPLFINAKNIGNVARFMNHSCSPNVYWQPVMSERDNQCYIRIVFFAINNIAPMRELTFDYGIIRYGNAEPRRKNCICRSCNCRGYFF